MECDLKQCNFSTLFRACLHEGGWPQVGEVTCGGLPHLTCKRDHSKTRDCMDWRVIPPERVTSPTRGPPSSCKQALSVERLHSRGQNLCKFIETKESVYIRREFNSCRICLGHQHGRRFMVLGHRNVIWKHSIQLIWVYFVASRSPATSNFIVICLCTRFSPWWFA